MRRLLPAILAVAGLSFFGVASISHAAVFERDLVPGSGDGLLTYDDVNQREWLDLSESILEHFPGADPGASLEEDLEARYQNAILGLEPGGRFEGFSVARQADVIALAESAGIDLSIGLRPENLSTTTQLMYLLSVTFEIDGRTQMRAQGYLDEFSTPENDPLAPRRLIGNVVINSCGSGCSGVLFSGGGDLLTSNNLGVMLFRPIPEPTSLALLCMAQLIRVRYGRSQLAS